MARPSILPLPDDQARRILRSTASIEAHLPPKTSNTGFLTQFIPLVHDVTGQIYGAATFQRLLTQFAPARRPSTTTIQAELRRYREHVATLYDPDEGSAVVAARSPSVATGRQAPPSAQAAWHDEEREGLRELMGLQRLELERARQNEAAALHRAASADEARERAVREATAARAELQSVRDLATSLQSTIDRLTAALQVATDRAAADNRMALMRVDAMRQEVRDVEIKLQGAQSSIAARDRDLREANTMIDSFRMQVARLRHQVGRQSE